MLAALQNRGSSRGGGKGGNPLLAGIAARGRGGGKGGGSNDAFMAALKSKVSVVERGRGKGELRANLAEVPISGGGGGGGGSGICRF